MAGETMAEKTCQKSVDCNKSCGEGHVGWKCSDKKCYCVFAAEKSLKVARADDDTCRTDYDCRDLTDCPFFLCRKRCLDDGGCACLC